MDYIARINLCENYIVVNYSQYHEVIVKIKMLDYLSISNQVIDVENYESLNANIYLKNYIRIE